MLLQILVPPLLLIKKNQQSVSSSSSSVFKLFCLFHFIFSASTFPGGVYKAELEPPVDKEEEKDAHEILWMTAKITRQSISIEIFKNF